MLSVMVLWGVKCYGVIGCYGVLSVMVLWDVKCYGVMGC